MTSKPRAQHPDMQAITDTSADIYEAIATLEYHGTPATRGAVTAATGLADDVIDQSLAAMLSEGLLSSELDQGEPVYVPTHRGWSAVPDQAEGKGLR